MSEREDLPGWLDEATVADLLAVVRDRRVLNLRLTRWRALLLLAALYTTGPVLGIREPGGAAPLDDLARQLEAELGGTERVRAFLTAGRELGAAWARGAEDREG